MTGVCKWLGFYLCMKEPSNHAALVESLPLKGNYKCDMLITLKESKESSGGMAFDVILKPAIMDSPPVVLMRNVPSKDISQEDIDKKLKEAEDRRIAVGTQKLMTVQKDRERAYEASHRLQVMNDSFVKEVEKKLQEKMEVSSEIKNTQIKLLQDKLREHAQRVEEIRRMGERSREELRERIDRKLEDACEKRELQLTKVQERIRQHQRHIEDVIDCSNKFSRDTEEKIIIKMENSLKNREEHLNCLLDRLQKHEQHIQEIRQNKMNQSTSSSSSFNDDSFSMLDEEVTQLCWRERQQTNLDKAINGRVGVEENEKNEIENSEKQDKTENVNIVEKNLDANKLAPYVEAEEDDEEEEDDVDSEEGEEDDEEGDGVDSSEFNQDADEKDCGKEKKQQAEEEEEEKLLIDLNNEMSSSPFHCTSDNLIHIQPTFVNKAYNEVFSHNEAFEDLFNNFNDNNFNDNNFDDTNFNDTNFDDDKHFDGDNSAESSINNETTSCNFKPFHETSPHQETQEEVIAKRSHTTNSSPPSDAAPRNAFRDVNVVVVKNLKLGSKEEAEKVFIENDDEYNDEDEEEEEEDNEEEDEDEDELVEEEYEEEEDDDDDDDDDDEIINYDMMEEEEEEEDEEEEEEEEEDDGELDDEPKKVTEKMENEKELEEESPEDESYVDEEEEKLEKEIAELELQAEKEEMEKQDLLEISAKLLKEEQEAENATKDKDYKEMKRNYGIKDTENEECENDEEEEEEDDDESFPPPPCSEDIIGQEPSIRLELM